MRAPSKSDDLRLAAMPWLVSRVLVVASLGAARHLVDHLGTVRRPIALRQGLLGWDAGDRDLPILGSPMAVAAAWAMTIMPRVGLTEPF